MILFRGLRQKLPDMTAVAHLKPFCLSAGKKEKSDAYVERAGLQDQAPKRSVGLQHPKP